MECVCFEKDLIMPDVFDTQPTLEGSLVILKPLTGGDFEALFEVASDPEIWEQHPAKERSERTGFRLFFTEAMNTKSAFLIIDKNSNEVIGSTRYKLSNESASAVEIGWTFLAKKYWGGIYNKEIKKLMIEYAFKYFVMVLFYIAATNLRSQKAVEKIGGLRINEIGGKPLARRPEPTVVYAIEKMAYKPL